MANQKGFASVVVVIVILGVIAVGGYLMFQTPPPVADNILPTPTRSIAPNVIATAGKTTPVSTHVATPASAISTSSIPSDWKTYHDPIYKYEFRYPSNWEHPVSPYDAAVTIYPDQATQDRYEDSCCSSFEVFHENWNFQGFEGKTLIGADNIGADFTKEICPPLDDPARENVDCPHLWNNTNLRYEFPFPGRQKINGVNELEIQINYPNNISAEDKAIYDQILSTFKFTN